VFSALSGCGLGLSSGQLGFGLQPVVQIMSFLPAALLIKAVRALADLFVVKACVGPSIVEMKSR